MSTEILQMFITLTRGQMTAKEKQVAYTLNIAFI